jgi:hypothetical protein
LSFNKQIHHGLFYEKSSPIIQTKIVSLNGGRAISIKTTVSVLCQSDRHFLAFSDTTRNERHRKSN